MERVASCPKCQAAVPEGVAACGKCGLAVDRMAGFAAAADAAIPEPLIAAWDRAVEQWDDLARHDEVLRLVTANDAYAWAAGRYRSKAGDPIGDRQLARIRKAAEATLMASRTEKRDAAPKAYRATVALLVFLLLAAIAGLIYTATARNGNAGSATPAGETR